MNIKEKFRFLEQIQQPRKEELKSFSAACKIEDEIGGEIIHSALGPSFVKTTEFTLDHQHGPIRLGQIDEISPFFLHLAGKDENLLRLDFKKSLFFDTETTGLAGGSGTYIFLCGIGYFSDDRFIIKQFFLRDFPEEPSMLHLIYENFSRFENIISFNGKSFDWPLLQSRFIHHRIKNALTDPPHFDLLHASRRIWKQRLQDCSLINLEHQILNLHRDGDIPSYLIPHLYFEYLRTKNSGSMKQIFYHNENDILSLVSLTIMLNRIHQQPLEQLSENLDLRTLAKYYENTNQWHRNIPIYQTLLGEEKDPDMRHELNLQLSFCFKRLGQWDDAAAIWLELTGARKFRFEPYEELAKYYEHRARDLSAAEKTVLTALERLEMVEQFSHHIQYSLYRENLSHRLKRIRQKKNSNDSSHSDSAD